MTVPHLRNGGGGNISDHLVGCLPARAVVLLGDFQSFSILVPGPVSCFGNVGCVCYPIVMYQDISRRLDLCKFFDLIGGRATEVGQPFEICKPIGQPLVLQLVQCNSRGSLPRQTAFGS